MAVVVGVAQRAVPAAQRNAINICRAEPETWHQDMAPAHTLLDASTQHSNADGAGDMPAGVARICMGSVGTLW